MAALLGAENAAALSACFLRDVAAAIEALPESTSRQGYGVYAPAGAEAELRALLPPTFGLVLQANADLGVVLASAARHLLRLGHDCVLLINSDSPTLPFSLLSEAIESLRKPGDRVVLGPAIDGGYYLMGLKADHEELFRDIPWSTADVFSYTVERARRIGLAVAALRRWYDVDDTETLAMLESELAGHPPAFSTRSLTGGEAAATRAFLAALPARRTALSASALAGP